MYFSFPRYINNKTNIFNFIDLRKFYPDVHQLGNFVQETIGTNASESNITNATTSSTSLFELVNTNVSHLIGNAPDTQNDIGLTRDAPQSNSIAFDRISTTNPADTILRIEANPKQPFIINGKKAHNLI